jgi:hypothetical protein
MIYSDSDYLEMVRNNTADKEIIDIIDFSIPKVKYFNENVTKYVDEELDKYSDEYNKEKNNKIKKLN